jgi:hypothetical protein
MWGFNIIVNKKMILGLSILLLLTCTASGNLLSKNNKINVETSNDQWIITPIELTQDGSLYIDIATGVEDDFFISYYDRHLDCLKVIFIKDESIVSNIIDSDGSVGMYSSIKADSNDNLHVSYYDSSNGDLRYAYWDGTEWDIQTVDSFGDVGLYTCIDVNSLGYPCISYYDVSNGNLKYCYWDGIEWNVEIVEDEGDVGLATSLVIDSEDSPHISYTKNDDNFLYYAKKIDSNWGLSLVDDDCTVFASTSIGIDSNNFAHISYFDVGTSGEDWNLKHAYFDGHSWFNEIVDPDLKYFWNDWGVSIVIDDFDRIHIGYYCWYRWDLKYAYKVNDKWGIETVESDGDSGAYASIVVNSENYPVIAYMSRSSIELRYAKKIEFSPDPPDAPIGPSSGKPNEIYSFEATGFDFDGDQVKLAWDWGDGSEIEYTDYYESGVIVQVMHAWSEQANYNVKVKVVDINGYESIWSEPLKFSISKARTYQLSVFLEKLLEILQIKI